MTQEEKITYVSNALKLLNIEIHKDLLEKVIKVINIIEEKKGETTISDILELKNK